MHQRPISEGGVADRRRAYRSRGEPRQAAVEIGRQMRAQVAGVVAGAVDQGGLSAAQELHPHQIHAGRGNDPAVMADHALAVENRQFEPGIVGPIAGGPDDRLDLARGEVHAERRRILDAGRRQAMRRFDRGRRGRWRAPIRRSGRAVGPS